MLTNRYGRDLHGKWERWVHGRYVIYMCPLSEYANFEVILDLVFNGGKFGIWVGNQQCVDPHLTPSSHSDPVVVRFTVRNITINNAATAIYGHWNWGESATYRHTTLPDWHYIQDGLSRELLSTAVRYHNTSQSFGNTALDIV